MEMKFLAFQATTDFQFTQTHTCISHTLTHNNTDDQLDATTTIY